jgi:hypothetical protein
MRSSLLTFSSSLNSVLVYLEIVGLRFPPRCIREFLCSMSAPLVRTVLLLDALQMLMFTVCTLTYFEPKSFLIIIVDICSSHCSCLLLCTDVVRLFV